jgi:tellurite resistance protein TehA-like permease
MKALIIIQVLIAFTAGLTALFLMYKSMNLFMKKKFQIEESNSAFAILQVGILISTSFN